MDEEMINRRLQEKKLSRKECIRKGYLSWQLQLESEIRELRNELKEIQKVKSRP